MQIGGSTGRFGVWNLETGERVGGLTDLPYSMSCQVDFQAKRAVTWNLALNSTSARLWDLSDGRQVGGAFPAGYTTKLLDNASVLFIASQKKLSFINPQTGVEIGAMEPPPQAAFWNGEVLIRGGVRVPIVVRAFAFSLSPDEKLAAVQTGDATLSILQTSTAKTVASGIATEGTLQRMVWSPDSRLVATIATLRKLPPATWFDPVASQFQIRVWDAATGTPVGEPIYPPAKAFVMSAFADDGWHLVLASTDGLLQIYGVPSGDAPERELRSTSAIAAASLVNRGQAVLLRRLDRTVHYRPLNFPAAAAQGAAARTPIDNYLPQEFWPADRKKAVSGLAVSPSGSGIYSARDNWTGQEWDLESQAQVGQVLQRGGIVNVVAVSRDGRLLATGSDDRSVRVWNAATHVQVAGPFWHSEPVTSVAFMPDATRVVSSAEDGAARIWDCRTNVSVGSPMRHAKAVRSVSVSADGSRIVTGSDDETARVWSSATTAPISEPLPHDGAVKVVAFSFDGRRFLTASGAVHQWDAETMEAVSDPMEHGAKIVCAKYSPDGETIVTACEDQTLRIWDPGSAQLAAPALKLDHAVRDIAFHPRGERFFTACGDGRIREWKLPAPLPDEPHRLRAWVEVATTQDSTKPQLERLSWKRWTERQEELSAAGGRVNSLAFSPDGKMLASTEVSTRRVSLWDPLCGELLRTLPSHYGPIYDVAFAPDGKTLATACGDGVVRLWDANSAKLLSTYAGGGLCLAFSPDGKYLASGGADSLVRIWEAAEAK